MEDVADDFNMLSINMISDNNLNKKKFKESIDRGNTAYLKYMIANSDDNLFTYGLSYSFTVNDLDIISLFFCTLNDVRSEKVYFLALCEERYDVIKYMIYSETLREDLFFKGMDWASQNKIEAYLELRRIWRDASRAS